MQTVISIVEIILVLTFLALIHELGHFLMAKAFKIPVEEFGLGMPPRAKHLFSWQGTDFTLNWIPFGAFVKTKGENDPNVPDGLASAPPIPRLFVLFGGPVANLLAGVLLFAAVYTQTGAPVPNKVMIASVLPNSQAGLQVNDVFVSINDQPITDVSQAISIIRAQPSKTVKVVVERNGQSLTLNPIARANPIIPVEVDAVRVYIGHLFGVSVPTSQEIADEVTRLTGIVPVTAIGQFGVSLSTPRLAVNYFEALPMALQTTGQQAGMIFMLPVRLIQGTLSPDEARISGPVGIASVFVQVREMDAENAAGGGTPGIITLNLIAAISVALGVGNLLPLPALDGGRILFVLPELILRRRVPPKFENAVHAIGILALLGLLFFLTMQDIFNPVILQR